MSYKKIFAIAFATAVLACGNLEAQSVSQTAPPPTSTLTAPGPQKHQPQQQRQPPLPGTRAPQPILQAPNRGNVEGFVYWDASKITHKPSGSCSGLAITVSVGSNSGGPLTAYTPIGTLSNNFKYLGQVKEFLAGGKVNVYEVCTYAFDHVPVGPNLQVKLDVTNPFAFSPYALPQSGTLGPIQVINGQCNMLPRISNPTVSDLLAPRGTCQNMASDVNFPMAIPTRLGGTITPVNSGGQSGMPSAAPQQGMLSPGNGQSAPGNSGTLLGNRQSGPGQSAGTAGPGGNSGIGSIGATQNTIGGATLVQVKPAAGTSKTPGAPSNRQSLTNADVINLMKAGLPETAIVSKIKSSQGNYDLSPTGCRQLQQAHVSPNVLNAMGDASVRPCSSTPPTHRTTALVVADQCERICTARCAQSTTVNQAECHKTCHDRCTVNRPTVVNLLPPKSHGKVTNPRATKQDEEIIAVLLQQKQAADRESAEITASLGIPAGSVGSVTTTRVPTSASLQGASGVQSLGPGTVQNVQGSLNSRIVHAPFLNTIVLTCASDPTPRIIQVSGGPSHTVFTPEPKYNPYTILGCGFGSAKPGNSAYLSAAFGFKANLNIDSWTDRGITVHLDPWLAGVLDQDNVTLILVPSVGRGIQRSGFSFYAARGMPRIPDKTPQEVPLAYNSIPKSEVTLSKVNFVEAGFDGLPGDATSKFPSFSYQGNPLSGWVFRYAYGHDDYGNFFNQYFNGEDLNDYFCYINGEAQEQIQSKADPCGMFFDARVNVWDGNLWSIPGADQWEIPLNSQFSISSYDIYYPNTDPAQICGAFDDSSKDEGHLGNWDFNLTGPYQITVNWTMYWCFDQEAWPFNRVNSTRQSSYGLAVWVWGPRCVDPIRGQPDPRCIDHVKKIYGG